MNIYYMDLQLTVVYTQPFQVIYEFLDKVLQPKTELLLFSFTQARINFNARF